MTRVYIAAAAFLSFLPCASAQTVATPPAIQMALLDGPAYSSSATPALPDAPSASAALVADGPTGLGPNVPPTASKYSIIVLPGQNAVPLHGKDYLTYSLGDAFNFTQLTGITLSAGYSHLVDSAPHYGRNAEAFGKREGAAALRSTIQTVATDAVFAPIFRDDPRYYVMGSNQNFFKRAAYAASRVVVTRSSTNGHSRLNAPLLMGYGVAAATNNAYYPDGDRTASQTLQSYAGSLGGAALGFEVSEFLDDALHLFHIRK